jgi:hypothetical protein
MKRLNLKIEKIITYRSFIDKVINPIRNFRESVKKKREITPLTKLLAYLMYLECYVPFLAAQGYMVKIKKN